MSFEQKQQVVVMRNEGGLSYSNHGWPDFEELANDAPVGVTVHSVGWNTPQGIDVFGEAKRNATARIVGLGGEVLADDGLGSVQGRVKKGDVRSLFQGQVTRVNVTPFVS